MLAFLDPVLKILGYLDQLLNLNPDYRKGLLKKDGRQGTFGGTSGSILRTS